MTFWSKLFNKVFNPLTCLGAGIIVAHATGTFAVPAHATRAAIPPLELVFVIDNSGSMKITDPQFTARQAVKHFVAQLDAESRVGLVLFDEKIQQLCQLHSISNKQDEDHFNGILNKINYNGRYTNGPGGIERALYDFKANGRPESRKAIIFISDGIVTSSSKDKKRDLIEWLKQDLIRELQLLHISVYGVAIAETADIALIQTLASRTDGEYFRANDASEISNALKRILARLNPIKKLPNSYQSTPDVLPSGFNPISGKLENGVDDKRPVNLEPKSWVFHLCLSLLTLLLVTTVIVLFTKYKQIQSGPRKTPKPDLPVNLPRAWLQGKNMEGSEGAAIFNVDKAMVTIGRGTQNDLCISQVTISIRHATIEYKSPAFYLTDLESTNGTRLNNDKLRGYESVRLKDGDTIRFGKLQYKFDMPDTPPFMETVMLEGTLIKESEDKPKELMGPKEDHEHDRLIGCLQKHLKQIEGIGPKFKKFVGDHLCDDTLNKIVSDGGLSLNKTMHDHQFHHTTFVKNKIFYLICTIPVEISGAADWYRKEYDGFTQFIHQWVNGHPYQSAKCDSICIVTFGKTSNYWVSITIVPTHRNSDPVEIISVDFLSDTEKSNMVTDVAPNGDVTQKSLPRSKSVGNDLKKFSWPFK